jgi:hypothetical protein
VYRDAHDKILYLWAGRDNGFYGKSPVNATGKSDKLLHLLGKNPPDYYIILPSLGYSDRGSTSEISRTTKSGIPAWVKIVIGIVLVAIILVAAAILTLTVTVQPPVAGVDYPYSANYTVSLPEGQQVTVGNEVISVLSYQNKLVTDVNGDREKLILGESRPLSEQGAKITTLGIPVIQTNFQITLR